MTMLVELVDVVVGVDTHKHTRTASIVPAATGPPAAQRPSRQIPTAIRASSSWPMRIPACGRGRSTGLAVRALGWPASCATGASG
jgi:hypothetical protein